MYETRNTFFVGYTPKGIGAPQAICDTPAMELRIDELLDERGISQTQLAADLGVKQPTVHRWVTGESSPPTKKLAEIAAYFKIDPLLLFREYGHQAQYLDILARLRKLDHHDVLAVETLVESLSTRPNAQTQQ
jgi:transcriptional regulator with XRE-family HTH domain